MRHRLTLKIFRDGSSRTAWFDVASTHRIQERAREQAVKYRRQGYLARVRPLLNRWEVCLRKPRKKAPGGKDL